MVYTERMTTEQLAKYLAEGGTDLQYFAEWVEAHSTDAQARELAAQLFANAE